MSHSPTRGASALPAFFVIGAAKTGIHALAPDAKLSFATWSA
jgi:hypothetical protein